MNARLVALFSFFYRTWAELRQLLVLTPGERRVIGFIVVAFFLGLGTKCYRDAHPHLVHPIDQKHAAEPRAQR
jgi:hypothetical protein